MRNSFSGWDGLLVGSILLLLGAIGFYVFVPQLSQASVNQMVVATRRDTQLATKLYAEADDAQREIEARTFDLTPEELGSKVLAKLTQIGVKRHLEVSRFSVARPTNVAGLSEARFLVAFSGTFPEVTAALAELEDPSQNWVVTDVKLDTANGTDQVTGNLAISGFLRGEKG